MVSNKYLVDYTGYKFQWTLAFCLCYVEYWPQNIMISCHLVVANVTSDQLFQYLAVLLPILQFPPSCNDNVPLFGGRLLLAVLSILQTIHCNGSLKVAFSFVRLHDYGIRLELELWQLGLSTHQFSFDKFSNFELTRHITSENINSQRKATPQTISVCAAHAKE